MTQNRAIGPDVSHWRPVKSWTDFLADPQGPSFMGIKATQGTGFVDPTLRAHRDGFRASPLLFAVYYHFASPGPARDQAHRLMDAVGDLDPRETLCLDFEAPVAANPQATLEWIDDFYSELLGNACSDRKTHFYSAARVWQELVGDMAWNLGSSDVGLWVKRYSESMLEPGLPRPWKDAGWAFWQWSDGDVPAASMAGVGKCDMNYFRGTREDLAAYVKTWTLPAPGGQQVT